jgi:hypothetical protein
MALKSRFYKGVVESEFWALVDKTSECWWWSGGRAGGYGAWRGFLAHRLSAYFAGMIATPSSSRKDDGARVLHKCDRPLCVRPDHLFVGSQTDNVRDCVSKGRFVSTGRPGELHHNARLTELDVRTMRSTYRSGGVTQKELAASYGISRVHAARILSGVKWKHI